MRSGKPIRRPLRTWGPAAAFLVALLLAACTSDGSPAGAAGTLSADLFPLEPARTAVYVVGGAEERQLRLEPTSDGATLRLEGDGAASRRIDVRRAPDAVLFQGGPQETIELLRLGAAPGAEWRSGAAQVRFEGWERVVVPAGTFDAARIRVVWGPDALPIVETWWFAPGAGLVRLRSDRGGIFSEEMSLAR